MNAAKEAVGVLNNNTDQEWTIVYRWLDNNLGEVEGQRKGEMLVLDLSKLNNEKNTGANCVVDLIYAGVTYWSWHLWFTDYIPGIDNSSTQGGQVHAYRSIAFSSGGDYYNNENIRRMMDRNLGATVIGVDNRPIRPKNETGDSSPFYEVTTKNVSSFYGLYYQWGRKDPFGKHDINAETKQQLAIPMGYSLIVPAIKEPGVLYYGDNAWCPDKLDLWHGNTEGKSPFDPCPLRWRVPTSGSAATSNPWAGFVTGSTSNMSAISSINSIFDPAKNSTYYFKGITTDGTKNGDQIGALYYDGTIIAWYPLGVYVCKNTSPKYDMTYIASWSASLSSTSSNRALAFECMLGSVVPAGGTLPNSAYTVRCVRDKY